MISIFEIDCLPTVVARGGAKGYGTLPCTAVRRPKSIDRVAITVSMLDFGPKKWIFGFTGFRAKFLAQTKRRKLWVCNVWGSVKANRPSVNNYANLTRHSSSLLDFDRDIGCP
jgi:hypothetical protein